MLRTGVASVVRAGVHASRRLPYSRFAATMSPGDNGFADAAWRAFSNTRSTQASFDRVSLLGATEIQLEDSEAPTAFPFSNYPTVKAFELEEQPGQALVKLGRRFEGEDVSVTFHVDDVVQPHEDEAPPEGEEAAAAFPVNFTVTIQKPSKESTLFFECIAHPEEVEVARIAMGTRDEDNEDGYGGPNFAEMDDQFAQACNDFLAERSIDSDLAAFICDYAMHKEAVEYRAWLKKLKGFLGK